MLTKEQNIRFTDVEPGSAMNAMAKRYWLPYLRSQALEANGAPAKVRLLGENYVSFRAADGTLGFFNEQCPHRGASLVLGRAGDNALTCIFHGWKFNVRGECLETPSEANERFCKSIKVHAYPVHEAGGVCWVYLGAGEPPAFPEWEFCQMPAAHRRARVGYTVSNWTQNLETLLDSAHMGILHMSGVAAKTAPSVTGISGVNTPRLTVRETGYGLQGYSLRQQKDGGGYLRVTEYIAPFTVLNGATRDEEGRLLMIIPIDNHNTAFWRMEWDMEHTQDWWVEQSEKQGLKELLHSNPDDFFVDSFDRSKPDFGQDQEAMRQGHWSGFKDLRAEDAAVAESVPMIDRSQENLGASDLLIAKMRQQFFKGLDQFEQGGPALGLGAKGDGSEVPYADLRGTAEMVAADTDLVELHEQVLRHERRAKRQAFLKAHR